MKKRIIYFDILKAIAILLVIVIHVISEYWDSLDVNKPTFIVLSFIDSLCRFSVPIYFMVSGAIFLNEEKKVTIKDVLKKYIPRILLLFFFWNLVYSFLNIIVNDGTLNFKLIKNIILGTLFGDGIFHLYFLPIIIGFYLCLPVLKNITNTNNRNVLKYLIIVLFLFFGFERILDYLFNISIYYTIVFGGYLIYFILGYYLSTFTINKKNTKTIYTLGIVGFLITFICTVLFSKINGITDVFFKYDTFNVIMYSSAVFLFIKNNFNNINEKILNVLSKTNFGIYLIHGLVLGYIEYSGLFIKLSNISIVLSVFISSIIIYFASLVLIFILLKIPYIKKLVSLERR